MWLTSKWNNSFCGADKSITVSMLATSYKWLRQTVATKSNGAPYSRDYIRAERALHGWHAHCYLYLINFYRCDFISYQSAYFIKKKVTVKETTMQSLSVAWCSPVYSCEAVTKGARCSLHLVIACVSQPNLLMFALIFLLHTHICFALQQWRQRYRLSTFPKLTTTLQLMSCSCECRKMVGRKTWKSKIWAMLLLSVRCWWCLYAMETYCHWHFLFHTRWYTLWQAAAKPTKHSNKLRRRAVLASRQGVCCLLFGMQNAVCR